MMIINYIMLSKTSAYVKSYDGETKFMWFMIEDTEKIQYFHKVSENKKKEFNRKPVYNKFFLKTKITPYDYEATDF